MKVHLSISAPIFGSLSDAHDAWTRANIIHSEARACDGLMMHVKDREFLTKDVSRVSCKHCTKKIKQIAEI